MDGAAPLSMGLAFAWLITLITQVSDTPYFAQHKDGTLGDRVCFSFTALTHRLAVRARPTRAPAITLIPSTADGDAQ